MGHCDDSFFEIFIVTGNEHISIFILLNRKFHPLKLRSTNAVWLLTILL